MTSPQTTAPKSRLKKGKTSKGLNSDIGQYIGKRVRSSIRNARQKKLFQGSTRGKVKNYSSGTLGYTKYRLSKPNRKL